MDKIDLSILKNIQKNGRMTNIQIAKIAGISAPPCLRRMKAMEKSGIISGYHAEINPKKMNFHFRCIAVIKLISQRSVDVTAFIGSILKIKNIRSCFSTIGGEEFILDIISEDLESYEILIRAKIQSNKNIESIKTYVIVNKYKDEYGIPL